jgi:diadenosine tetraphosphate (Ap4A) HIT family hydrolase
MHCVFCHLGSNRIAAEDDFAVLIDDAYPVSPGHCLIIPKRHVQSFFETSAAERDSLFLLARRAKARLEEHRRNSNQPLPAGYNLGVNDGSAAGQTVPHLHLHVIPRYAGDSHDPRGGIRWLFPQKANYWD